MDKCFLGFTFGETRGHVYHIATYTERAAITACTMDIKQDEVATIVEMPTSLDGLYNDLWPRHRVNAHELMDWAVATGKVVKTFSHWKAPRQEILPGASRKYRHTHDKSKGVLKNEA